MIASSFRNVFCMLFLFVTSIVWSQTKTVIDLPVRGFSIAAPLPKDLDRFLKFVKEELVTRKVNTLVLRIQYNYQFESHPELRDSIALSKQDVKRIVSLCKAHGINLIPQINLLGHQSWANRPDNLLRVYPQFDETPHIKMPEKYVWPNEDGLYCKSYCPLHPEVHNIVFSLVDELCEVFEASAYHAGLDEVFYIGDDKCPRCGGRDKAELFADEVRVISEHLALNKRQLWMWGDRLLDGKSTGLGMWEASYNNTYRAIDMIPKNVMICDWHYERPDKTPIFFAMKGFKVITCPWRNPGVAILQLNDMITFRRDATPAMKENFQGMMQTVWSPANIFLDGFYNTGNKKEADENSPWNCFRIMYSKMN
jgi:hypothetical protein